LHQEEKTMKADKEERQDTATVPTASRQWVAPKLTVLSAGATAGGPVVNTEAYNYAPPLS
jgi:hypothetical protein